MADDSDDHVYTTDQIRKFKRAAKALAELGRDGAIIYLADEGSLHLLSGPSHDDGPGIGRQSARQDRIVASVTIPGSGGGGW